jgi:hypothetical protein
MCGRIERTVGSDEGARSYGDNTGVQESTIEVYVHTISNPETDKIREYSTIGRTAVSIPEIGPIVNPDWTVYPWVIREKELVCFFCPGFWW